MNLVDNVPIVQPIASYPIISAITAVASGCSRFCGFTDLGQAISLVRQGKYCLAGGKALEGTLRLGVLVAVVWSLNEISNLKENSQLLEKRLWESEYKYELLLKVNNQLGIDKSALQVTIEQQAALSSKACTVHVFK